MNIEMIRHYYDQLQELPENTLVTANRDWMLSMLTLLLDTNTVHADADACAETLRRLTDSYTNALQRIKEIEGR